MRGVVLRAMLALVTGCALAAEADEWRGWRGGEAQGRSHSDKGPVAWSPGRYVVWKTPIPGRGHSSPVVTRDSVYVTTGYAAAALPLAKRAAMGGVLVVAALAAVAGAVCLVPSVWRWDAAPWREFLGVLALAALMGVVGHLVFVGYVFTPGTETGHTFGQTRWQVSGAVACLGLMLAASRFAPRSRGRLVLGIAAALAALLVFLARPNPEYYRPSGGGDYAPLILAVPAVALGLGIVILLRAALTRRGSHAQEQRQQSGPERVAIGGRQSAIGNDEGWWAKQSPGRFFGLSLLRLALLGAVALIGLMGLRLNVARVAIKMMTHVREAKPGLMSSFAWPESLLPVVLVAAGIWLVAEAGGLWPRRTRLGRLAVAGLLCLPALMLVERNWLGTRREFARAIICLDRATGAVKWTRPCAPGPELGGHPMNSQASPTPIVDDERVYAYFGPYGLVATDLAGKLVWTCTELPFERITHGVGASPVLADGRIIIDAGQPDEPYVAAVDCRTGKLLWKTPRPRFVGTHEEHRPPTIASVEGRKLVLIWGWRDLRAYDLATGKELACRPIERLPGGEIVTSLVVDGDVVYLPYYRKCYAVSLTRLLKGEDPILWATDLEAKGPNTSSPVLVNGLLFMASDTKGWATCLDAKTGALVWRERLPNVNNTMSSFFAIGDLVYISHVSGVTHVIRAARKFELIAENDLREPLFATPAPVDGRLYLRTAGHLWCIGG